MKILFTSYVFSPRVGGIETVSALLVAEFVKAGHEVRLVTKTREDDKLAWPCEVIRGPGLLKQLELVRWCDVFFQNNISLELAWPLLFVRRPWIITHHTWLDHDTGQVRWKPALKKYLLRFAHNASVSRFMAESLPVASVIVGDPYAFDVFRRLPGIKRDRELIFLGRLVSDKGVDLLLEALAELRRRGLKPGLTIIGSGPEREALKTMTRTLQIEGQVEFLGSQTGEKLARTLNSYQIMVVPSRWAEPFGIVALEGIACGCAIVASRSGGLPEAVGPCGLMFNPDDTNGLANAIERALTQPELRAQMQEEATAHLAWFVPTEFAARHLRFFTQIFRHP